MHGRPANASQGSSCFCLPSACLLVCLFYMSSGMDHRSSRLQGQQQDGDCGIFPAQVVVSDIRKDWILQRGNQRTVCCHHKGWSAPGRCGDMAQGCLGEFGSSMSVLSCSGKSQDVKGLPDHPPECSVFASLNKHCCKPLADSVDSRLEINKMGIITRW